MKIVNKGKQNDSHMDDELDELQNTPPNHLSVEAKRLWRNLVPELKKLGYLKRADQANVEQYCNYYALYLKAEEVVNEYGPWLENEDGVPNKRSPALMQLNDCVKNMKSLGNDLGLTFDSGMREITVQEPVKKSNKSPLKGVRFGAEV
ncbi:MAG TPA: phage terminase small subunit P27 family [Lactobacillus acetotolerans]|nr:phage terminase small subunit P27 family [Lactobacillus acetotolerans]